MALLTSSLHPLSNRVPHIGLNLIFLVPGETGGMEVYARELIPAMLAAAPETRFTAFVSREASVLNGNPWGGRLRTVTVPVKARDRVQWVLGEQTLLPVLAARDGIDLMHSLASTAPAWGPFRRIVTVHDLIYAHFPDAHAGIRDRGMRVLVPLAVRTSQRVIAISTSTRNDVMERFHTPDEKIDVVPQGLGTIRRVAPLSERETRERFGLGERPVVLSLSAKRPHKNLLALLGALARIHSDHRPLLVLPGYATWHEAELRERVASLGLQADVRFVGWLSEEELEGLWALAMVFIYPSLYEGFGLPVLEAMARGVPVACSNVSSLPEVVGDAALLFDPRDEGTIAGALEQLLNDQALASRFRERGLERAQQFTWAQSARLTLESYARTLGLVGGLA